jgi:hypothetical protein
MGRNRDKNAVKKQFMGSLRKYAEQLEKENKTLKEDPQSMIGQFIGQFREIYSQNLRLSTLAACLIKQMGDEAILSKEEMELFNGKRINIKWEIADGETVETAKEYTFSYELQDAPPEGQPVQATEDPAECTDPNCTLPKDLKHSHDSQPSAVEGSQTEVVREEPANDDECTDPDCEATVNGPHIHEKKLTPQV